MPTKIIFPYRFKVTTFGKIPDPVIKLTVHTPTGLRKIGFLVDSGSDTITLPLAPYHYWFNFKPEPFTATSIGGVEGKGVTAYPSKITLTLGNEKITTQCYFVRSNTMPLLGRLDLWDKFLT